MRKRLFIFPFFIIAFILGIFFIISKKSFLKSPSPVINTTVKNSISPSSLLTNDLQIQAMRSRQYPGSAITIEQTLDSGSNYDQYITSYRSDGFKIYALLTIPRGEKPKDGWPVIVFNHGYIPPQDYQTNPSVGQYASYLPVFARSGYIVFKPDYRGNGNSQGRPEGAYYSSAYAVDDLNAIASIKKYKGIDPSANSGQFVDTNKIGIWAHSMGGNITLRDLVVHPNDVKVAVIWGGVVGSYEDLSHWHDPKYQPPPEQLALRNKYHSDLVKQYGSLQQNPSFWNSIDPTSFVGDITAPIQLDVGGSDEEVPPSFSQSLRDKLQKAGKVVEYYEYPGSDHNISQGFDLAMQRSLEFFDTYLK